jgi:hypothetical protein
VTASLKAAALNQSEYPCPKGLQASRLTPLDLRNFYPRQHLAQLTSWLLTIVSQKKAGKLIEFTQPHDSVACFEAFVGRLVESNDVLASALVRIRDFYLAGAPPLVVDSVLAQVEIALERATRAKNGF